MRYLEDFATMHWYKKLFEIFLSWLKYLLLYVFVSIPLSTEKKVEATLQPLIDGEYGLFGFPNCGTACPVAIESVEDDL